MPIRECDTCCPDGYLNYRIDNRGCKSLALLCLTLLIGIAAQASPAANFAPYFAGGTRQAIAVCGDSGPLTVNSELAIVDSDAGQTESWTVSTPPAHGTLGGFPVTATSTGGLVTPSWLYYTPAAGFAGIDSFTVAATDGAANATTTIVVTVNPTPALTSPLAGSVCDQGVFSYTPVTSPAGVTVTWHRASMPGISNPPNSGIGNPNEPLYNITNDDAVTTYNFSMSANGCSSNANVVVTVHPTPRLSSPGTDSVCSGGTLYYVPASPTAGTSFSWSRSAVAGIEPNAPSSGSGTINEVLTNTTGAPVSTIYSFMLQAHGCTAARSLLVTVLPPEAGTPITTHTAATVCSGAQFQNFGAAAAPAPGYSYAWSATNATVWATGSTSQYCLVSFDAPGEAVVTLTTGNGVGCASGSTYTVLVGNDIAAPGTVIYYNNQFVFQDNTQDTYQWGYDDAATLDSALIQGATFQSYGNAAPDLTGKYYWVLTTKGGCMQKTYFNTPLATPALQQSAIALQLSPNPAEHMLQVSLTGYSAAGSLTIVITDMAGRVLLQDQVKGNNTTINVAALPVGCYLVSCYASNIKMATSRFIKSRE